jgi:hypothetical protein
MEPQKSKANPLITSSMEKITFSWQGPFMRLCTEKLDLKVKHKFALKTISCSVTFARYLSFPTFGFLICQVRMIIALTS